ncbi:Ig-like domain-containing protein [Algibacter sp. L4_22]|uniref:Ig-like domain-containing protein n=1 Tax=Algibacter sp. L4_22 TaxID=2942477 RepID=UPI00201B64CF|nr:Ig-like domain-containing protein [Algibacter sp. L4_22]MCL5129867.1 Ig-like domain-containing protein [Algibacter sp. L4_22]
MKLINKPRAKRMLPIGILLSTILLSCSTENEELFVEEAAVTKDAGSNEDVDTYYVGDDNFTVRSSKTQVFDVLINDNIPNFHEVRISDVSKPTNGTITVNEDHTIEYVAPISGSEISDTFTYTVEALDGNGELFTGTGDVTVIVSAESKNYLFTAEAKKTLRDRFTNGYITGVGFTDDFIVIKDNLDSFKEDPTQYRPTYGESPLYYKERQILSHSALYAYALDNVEVANAVASEILATIRANDLNTSYFSGMTDLRAMNSYMIQTSSIKKMKDSYTLTKHVQDVLTDEEKALINEWFATYKNILYKWFRSYTETYWGVGWDISGISKFKPEGIYPYEYGDPYPIKDVNGNSNMDYTMAWAQDIFNNRILDALIYLESWAVSNSDLEIENFCRELFKNVIKYGTFSDGTFWELIRNKSVYDNSYGVYYTNVSLTTLISMAHLDAMANHFPGDKLYDYKTTDGIVQGSTNLTILGYAGSSTTDGITQKSLKTLIMGQSKYLRNSANGGWNDIRFYNNEPLSIVGRRHNSVLAAMANLYYNDVDLKNYYLFNSSVGYPSKKQIVEGYGLPEDYGAWGNLIIGGAWFEQENNFFK